MQYATIDLTRSEHDHYYNGFSNGVLWPLLHSMPELMRYDRRDAQVYRQVNQRLVSVLAPQLRPTDVIWLHDYHLMAMPALLRAQGVVAPIGFFLHVPFPSADVFGAMPEAGPLLRDLLAADLLGFHTDNDVENFAARGAAACRGHPHLRPVARAGAAGASASAPSRSRSTPASSSRWPSRRCARRRCRSCATASTGSG